MFNSFDGLVKFLLKNGVTNSPKKIIFSSLFTARGREGRPSKRGEGESSPSNICASAFALTPRAELTHPVIASLDHPLFCKQKEGRRILNNQV